MNNTISTNELYHYTATFENLQNILETGFTPVFCCEEYLDGNKYWTPMVCFCDIPLNLTEEHRNMYGNYVIGMKKEWVKGVDIHPVNYICNPNGREKHSVSEAYNTLKKSYIESIKHTIDKEEETLKDFGKNSKLPLAQGIFQTAIFQEFLRKSNELYLPVVITMAYEKPFDGKQYNKQTDTFDPKKFYDEKEWRYLLPLDKLNDHIEKNFVNGIFTIIEKGGYLPFHYKDSVLENEFNSYDQRKKMLNGENLEKVKKYSLQFQPIDIEKIIVTNKEEVDSLKAQEGFEHIAISTWKEFTHHMN